MKALLTGAQGQLGSALRPELDRLYDLHTHSRADFDLTDRVTLTGLLADLRPSLIVNAAAYTAVDKAESDRATVFAVNKTVPRVLADWADANDCALVHYSTEYAYDGSGDRPRFEVDRPNSINTYWESKVAGDFAVLDSGAAALILRTAWLYDATSSNFHTTILRQAEEHEVLRMVDDQIGAPTSAAVLTRTTVDILQLLGRDFVTGFINRGGLVGAMATGSVSHHEFAEEIVKGARGRGHDLSVRQIVPISSSALKAPAARAANSRLSLERLSARFGIRPMDWRTAVGEALDERFSTR